MNAQTQQAETQTNVVTLRPARLPMDGRLAKEYSLTSTQWRVLSDQIFPNAQTVEAVLMALEYCRARNLDIFKRPVHIVPMWDSSRRQYIETVWPGISEIRTTAHRTRQYAGCEETEFGPEATETFSGRVKQNGNWVDHEITLTFPAWAKVTVYKLIEGHRVPYTAKVFWKEAYATQGKADIPNSMWCKRPYGQLDKCAEAAALRKAFPEEIGNEYAAEEMHGQIIEHDPAGAQPKPAEVPPPPPPPEPETVEEPPAQDAGPPPPPPEDDETPDPGELLEKAELWFDRAETGEALDEAFTNFENLHRSDLSDDDWETVRGLYGQRLEQINPNPLGGG